MSEHNDRAFKHLPLSRIGRAKCCRAPVYVDADWITKYYCSKCFRCYRHPEAKNEIYDDWNDEYTLMLPIMER